MTATDPLLAAIPPEGRDAEESHPLDLACPGLRRGWQAAARATSSTTRKRPRAAWRSPCSAAPATSRPNSASVFGGQIYVGDDSIIPCFQDFSQRIHRHGAALICQLTHMGRRTVWHAGNWVPTIAPSRVREPQHRSYPREMEAEDIERVIACYAAAARRCWEGGLDGCEILTHGHLIDQFLSPITNRRTDGYGGDLAGRMRFGREVLAAVRAAVPEDFIVGLRMGGGEDRKGGIGEAEAIEIAPHLRRDGSIDYLNIVFGRAATDLELAEKVMPTMDAPLAPFLERVRRFKQAVELPVFHAAASATWRPRATPSPTASST